MSNRYNEKFLDTYAQLTGFVKYVMDNPDKFDSPVTTIVNTLTHDIVGVYRASKGEEGYDVFLPKSSGYAKYTPKGVAGAIVSMKDGD
jgi:hypothetical protein